MLQIVETSRSCSFEESLEHLVECHGASSRSWKVVPMALNSSHVTAMLDSETK